MTQSLGNPTMSQQRVLRSSRIGKATREGKRVETANSLDTTNFFKSHCPAEVAENLQDVCLRSGDYLPIYGNAEDIRKLGLLDGCFEIIGSTSEADYKNSEIGWSPSKKIKEMMLPDMRYIVIVRSTSNATPTENPDLNHVSGFISFMITYEDAREVAYIYEIHLTGEVLGTGLGKALIKTVESISQSVGVEKVMLTVFKANSHAIEWYCRQGYGTDEFSPGPRKLRNGMTKEPSYVIFSKPL